MFYSQFILAKKGPLGTIWIAAHLERKLRKNQVADTDIGVSVDSILSPEVPIALRLSSHLLLGVVRIYSRKVNYLFHDCSETLLKVKQAFRSTAVDLPPEESTAPYHSITLPETFDLDDFELPDSEAFQGNFVDHHVSTREQITLQDSMDGALYSTSQFGLDERFGDGDTSQGLDLDEELFLDKVTAPGHGAALLDSDNVDPQASGQPMTPFTPFTPFADMDIDDDDQTMFGEDRIVEDMDVGANGLKVDSNAQDQKIVNDPNLLCDGQTQSLNFDGDGFPIKQTGKSFRDPLAGSIDYAPSTSRSMEEVVPSDGNFHDSNAHGLMNGTSLCNSDEMTMQDFNINLQDKSEFHDKRVVAQEILGDLNSEPSLNINGTTEAGDCSVFNSNSETDASHMLLDMQGKQQGGSHTGVDMSSISVDVGNAVSSPTSVLIEQPKPASPVSGVLDRHSALPDTVERAQTSHHETLNNGNCGSTDVELIYEEVVAAPDRTMYTSPSSTMETCNITVLSSDNLQANFSCQFVSEVRSLNGCVSHETSEAVEKVSSFGSLVESGTPYNADTSMESGADEHGKDEGRACVEPDVAEVQHHDEQSYEHSHVLRACNFPLKQPASVVPAERDFKPSTPNLPSMGVDPCLLAYVGQEPVCAAEVSAVVQGEECQQTSTIAPILETSAIFGAVPSNSQGEECQQTSTVAPVLETNTIFGTVPSNSQDEECQETSTRAPVFETNTIFGTVPSNSQGEECPQTSTRAPVLETNTIFGTAPSNSQGEECQQTSTIAPILETSTIFGAVPSNSQGEECQQTSTVAPVLETNTIFGTVPSNSQGEECPQTSTRAPVLETNTIFGTVPSSSQGKECPQTSTRAPALETNTIFGTVLSNNQGEDCQQTSTRAPVLETNTIFGTVPSNSEGEECPQTSTRAPVLETNTIFGTVPSNSQGEECPQTSTRAPVLETNTIFGTVLSTSKGEDCQQTSIRAPVLETNTLFGTVPSNSQVVDFNNFKDSLNTVVYKNSQSVNLNFPASCDWALPAPERFISATAAVPFAPSEHTMLHKDSQSVNLNFPASCDFAVPAPGRLLPEAAAIPSAPSEHTVIYKEKNPVNLNVPTSFDSAIPAPERLLSAPAAASFATSASLPQSTSMSTERNVSGSGFETLSGRKRPLMEASPVQRNGNPATLTGMQFQRTVNSVPDDYDLLSSILVGKNSSALKLRPTPQQSEIAPRKRQRVTPRTSVAKRKVLLDDNNVLHGDVIRQQLTSTEDIRRIRKKAPCTRPEIWMIQKHLLEEEIFVEPLFTGMSLDLATVQRRTYGVPHSRYERVSHRLPKVPEKVFHPRSNNLVGVSNTEGPREPVVVGNGSMEKQISDNHLITAVERDTQRPPQSVTDISALASQKDGSNTANTEGPGESIVVGNEPKENRLPEEHLVTPVECDTQEQTRPVTDTCSASQKNGSDIAVDMMAHSDTVIMEPPLVTNTISEEKRDGIVALETESLPLNESNGIDTALRDENSLDIPSVDNDVFMKESSSHIEHNGIHVTEGNKEGLHLDGLPTEKEGSVQEISESRLPEVVPQVIPQSSTVKVVPEEVPQSSTVEVVPEDVAQSNTVEVLAQDIPQDHLVDARQDVMLDNCLMESTADGLSDACIPLGNDKPLIPITFVVSEESTDPNVVSEAVHVIKDEDVNKDAENSASNPTSIEDPLRESSCPLECKLDTETLPSNQGESISTQEAGVESSSYTEKTETVALNEGEDPGSAGIASTSYTEKPETVPSTEGEKPETVPSNEGDNPVSHDADLGRTTDAENVGSQVADMGVTVDDEAALLGDASGNEMEDDDALDDNDTGFLNYDDDEDMEEEEAAREGGDKPGGDGEEATGILDNSGWSSRTRGVARYLQSLFDTQSDQGQVREVVPLDKLLSGKSRKEASRMFFETLVLKTRDYIHVEQERPFDLIHIKPKPKLLKSEF